jgi:hypothetical protein
VQGRRNQGARGEQACLMKCTTVKLGDKEQIGVKEPFPLTNLLFTS